MTVPLKDIFLTDINRHIDGVIKADDTASLGVELEEYVVTKEVAKRPQTLRDAYNGSSQRQSETPADSAAADRCFFGHGCSTKKVGSRTSSTADGQNVNPTASPQGACDDEWRHQTLAESTEPGG